MIFGNSIFNPESSSLKIKEALEHFLNETPNMFFYEKQIEAIKKFLECSDIIEMRSHKRVPWSKVVSHYDKGVIYYNPKKYRVMNDSEILGNLTHEGFHHLGYTHDFNWTKDRKYSIPYFLGYWVEFYWANQGNISLNDFIMYIQRIK